MDAKKDDLNEPSTEAIASSFDDYEDISKDGGVLKKIIKGGLSNDDSEKPKQHQEVSVHYTGSLLDGTVFDSSRTRSSSFKFQLGAQQVIKGWDIGVSTMFKGEQAIFIIRSDYAYGDKGMPPTIPEKATLKFDVELLDFNEMKKNKSQMTAAEKLQGASESATRGNEFFLHENFSAASEEYKEAISLLENSSRFSEQLQPECNKILLSANLNLSNCCLKTQQYYEAIQYATSALNLSPNNCKALFRRGVSHMHIEEFPEAKKDLLAAAHLEPQNVEIRNQLRTLKEKWDVVKKKQSATFRGLFDKVSLYTEKKDAKPERKLDACPKVFLDIKIRDETKRLAIALYTDTVPKTVENFRALCTGSKGSCTTKPDQPLHYKNSVFHRLIKGFMLQGGDITEGDGTGGESIYGKVFDDEKFVDQHTRRGLLSMANRGQNTNGSQFFITFGPAQHLDGKHVVFGEIIEGIEALETIESIPTVDGDHPETPITIIDCGEL